MKRELIFRNYYEEYLDVCSSITPKTSLYNLQKLIKSERPDNNFRLPFGICLIDYSKLEYKYISDNCQDITSYTNVEYIKNGPGFHALKVFHPEDRTIFDAEVFNDIREYWNKIPSTEIADYRFSFNHRYIRKDGTVSQLLQQGNFMEPQAGIPVLHFLTFSDIGDFKTDTTIVLTISRLIKDQGYVRVFSKAYPQPVISVLSKREEEILQLCYDGLSCKMIAEKLFLSMQTVKNHKRNMMGKTSVGNITGLIKMGIKNNWI